MHGSLYAEFKAVVFRTHWSYSKKGLQSHLGLVLCSGARAGHQSLYPHNSVCLRGHELPATYSSTLSTVQLKRKRNHCLFFAMLVLGHQRAIKPRYKHRNQPMYEYACHTSWHVMPTYQLQTSANHSTAGQSLFCVHTVYTRTCACVNQHHHISFLSHGLRFNISPVMEGSSTRNLPRETND